MDEILYLTGGNTQDKETRQITYDEAEKMLLDAQNGEGTSKPICSMIVFRENTIYRKVIYFTFQVVVIDLETTKQIWYEKVNDNEYFVDKIVYNNYNKLNKYLEVHFRNHTFSDPNICMIRMQGKKDWEYFVGDIEDSFFYRVIEFGDTETIFKDLDTNFEPFLHHIKKCDKRFIRE